MTSQCSFTCSHCNVKKLCLANSLDGEKIEIFDEAANRKKPLRKGQMLFDIGNDFRSLYVVRTGAFKVFEIDEAGVEQVLGFYLPGDIIGLEAIESKQYGCSAKALETSAVCEISFKKLEDFSDSLGGLQQQIVQAFSHEIRRNQDLQRLLGKKTADERIWGFLIDMSQRHAKRGLQTSRFRLPMSRIDIANYVGLAVETVSRIITRLQNNGLIAIEGKEVVLLQEQGPCPTLRIVPAMRMPAAALDRKSRVELHATH
jgi:CRP/FNR family transcriptional regulator, anaerobic regulatory protein